ncbi:MAG TPA: glycosyltransferase [Dehalococcoidia bacterium]|nr:glycosyltransferase [Dehalococcoidia bacterium]
MTPAASVIVPTYRRPDTLLRCLAALLAQEMREPFEIVVVDDEPAAATRAAVDRAAAHAGEHVSGVRYLRNGARHGPAAARNAGWRAAAGAIIAFTDDDCIPQARWLSAGIEALRPGADAASGRVVVPVADPPTDAERNLAGLERSRFATASAFYRRDALEAAGGFDERFAAAWREDSDLYLRLEERGARLADAPDALVVHPARPPRWGGSIGEQRKSAYNALLYRKHPRAYWREIQPAPPWRYYATVVCGAAAGAGVVTRRGRIALAGGAGWLALTAWFAGRRLRGASHAPAHVADMLVTSAVIPPLAVYWRLRGALRYRTVFL